MTGTLSLGSIEQFQAAVGNEQRAVIIMEGPGGNLSAGIEIGTRIRLRGYRTVVDQFATCSSACALAWLGGTSRHLDTKSRVGFHAAYEDDSGKIVESGMANARIGAYANRLGLSDESVVFITSAKPTGMTWLDTRSSKHGGLTFAIDAASQARYIPD